MSATEALSAAYAVGVRITVEGDDLMLAASKEPPAAVLDLLSQHKAAIVKLLRPLSRNWSAEDWRAFFDERAGIAEFDAGLSRTEAEAQAFACCVAEWLNHHPVRSPPGRCHACGGGEQAHDALLPHGVEPAGHAWLHRGCGPAWHDERNAEAVAALGAMGITAPDSILSDIQDISPEPVRQRDDDSGRTTTSLELTNAPAHRPEDLCLHVCDGVRIVSDDLQWIIQTKKGKANAKSSGWKPRGFCRSRVGLRRVLRDLLGKAVTEDDIAKQVDAFPEFHHIWLAGLDAPSPARQA